jgi:hypothetical protein
MRDANADLRIYIDTAVEVSDPERIRAVLDELRTALDSTTNDGLFDLQQYALNKLNALENPGPYVEPPALRAEGFRMTRNLVRSAASQTTPDGMREANLDLRISIDQAVEVKDPERLRVLLDELRTALDSTDNEGLWDLLPYAQDKLESLENPVRHVVRSHYQELGGNVTGTEFGSVTIQPLHKEALTLLRGARVGELFRSLAYVNTLRPGTGLVPDGSFVGKPPSESLVRLEQINSELTALRPQATHFDSTTNQRIAALEAERDRLLTTGGVAPSAGFVLARGELLQSLRAGARLVREKHEAFTRAKEELARAEAYLASLTTVSPAGDIIVTNNLEELDRRTASKNRANQAMVAARTTYLTALNGNALLTTTVEIDGFDEGPLWQVLNAIDTSSDPALDKDKTAQLAIDQGLVNLEASIKTEIVRIGEMGTTYDLMSEFGTPLYDPLRSRLVVELGPIYGPDVIGSMMTAVRSAYVSFETDVEFYNRVLDNVVLGAQVLVAAGMFLFPPSAVVLVPVEVALTSFQVGVSGGRIILTWQEQARAEEVLATGGSVTHAVLVNYEDLLSAQYFDFILTVAMAPLDYKGGLDALRYASELKTAAKSAGGAADEVVQATRPVIRAVSNARSILDRIDREALAAWPRVTRYGAPGDAEFFLNAGLGPQRTVTVRGTDFHLSAPFRDREGKAAIIAFQETPAGTVVPRTFYFSNEHSVWRAATGFGNGVVQKGPFRILDIPTNRLLSPEEADLVSKARGMDFSYPFVNESSVDLAGELQGTLTRWVNEKGTVGLADDVRDRAFFGHLEAIYGWTPVEEFNLLVRAEDVVTPLAGAGGRLAEGLRPAPTPLDQWVFVHPLYGRSEGFIYRAQDGSTLYTVVRPSNGDVFVPSIQPANGPVTPFGTPQGTFGTPLTSTPLRHKPRDTPGPEYIPNETFRNPLNDYFRQNLPPPGSAGTTGPFGRRSPVPWLVIPGLLDLGSAGPTSPPPAAALTGQAERYVIQLNDGVNPVGAMTSPGIIDLPIFPFRPVTVPPEAGGGTLVPFQATPETKDTLEKAIQNDKRFGFLERDWPRRMEAGAESGPAEP